MKIEESQKNSRMAERFLDALGGGSQTFQTYPDKKKFTEEERKRLTRVLHGRYEDLAPTLRRINKEGGGIFITINKTDLMGRSACNILELRAVFADADNVTPDLTSVPRPSLIVQSKRGPHLYWLLKDGEPLNLFKPTQLAIAKKLGTDLKIHDLPRVLRLPDFDHLKDPTDPFRVKLLFCNKEIKYSLKELHEFFPITSPEEIVSSPKNKIHTLDKPVSFKSDRVLGKGVFRSIVSGDCPALKRLWSKPDLEIGHIQRLMLMSLAIHCKDGAQILLERWPSDITRYQMEYALRENILPWSCKRMKEHEICLLSDSLTPEGCFLTNGLSKVSPIRLAYGNRGIQEAKSILTWLEIRGDL